MATWFPSVQRRSVWVRIAVGFAAIALVLSMYDGWAVAREDDKPTASRSAAILPVHGVLTDVTVDSLKRRIAEAKSQGIEVIVFDLDTPGGLVTSSISIADLIKNLSDIKTVAWVHPDAISGGTIVSVACDEIVMARSSRMGDSQVIMGGPGGAAAVPEELQPKAYTPVLAEFRSSCRLNGYDQKLCEAFVLPDREVWWIENKETDDRKFVFRDEKIRLLGESTKAEITATDEKEVQESDDDKGDGGNSDAGKGEEMADTPGDSQWRLVETYFDSVLEMEVDVIQPIVPDTQLLMMSAGEAQAYGFSKGVVSAKEDLRTRYALTSMFTIQRSWSESLATWLTSMYVRGFLMVIILLGAYVEFHTPGVGVPGLVALISLSIFVGAPYLTGLADVWEILIIGVGFGLIGLEAFVIPGFGIAGILGIVLLFAGLLATFLPPEPGKTFPLYLPSLPSTLSYLKAALATMVASTATSIVGMVMLSRFLPRMVLFQRIAPLNPTPTDVQPGDPYDGVARVGDVGVATSPLHPSGKARFSSLIVDVVTRGEYIEADVRVEVVERRGNRVVVRPVA